MKKIFAMVTVGLAIVIVGSILFSRVEHRPLLEGFYFTLTTLSTVGYGDLSPATSTGRWVAMSLMVLGVGAALYIFSSVTSFVVEGRLRRLMGVRKMKKKIEGMHRHYVICGYGKLGKVVARQIGQTRNDFVIIEANAQKAQEAREQGYSVVEGDATLPETLARARLDHAAGLATSMADDAENLFIGITARSIVPEMSIVCRSSGERARQLFARAGLHNTISTDEMGARRLVNSLTRPHIAEFVDEMTQHVEGKSSLHAVRLEDGAPLIGQTIIGAQLRDRFDITVLAINRTGSFLPNPRGDEVLQGGDILILIGRPERITRLRALLQGVA